MGTSQPVGPLALDSAGSSTTVPYPINMGLSAAYVQLVNNSPWTLSLTLGSRTNVSLPANIANVYPIDEIDRGRPIIATPVAPGGTAPQYTPSLTAIFSDTIPPGVWPAQVPPTNTNFLSSSGGGGGTAPTFLATANKSVGPSGSGSGALSWNVGFTGGTSLTINLGAPPAIGALVIISIVMGGSTNIVLNSTSSSAGWQMLVPANGATTAVPLVFTWYGIYAAGHLNVGNLSFTPTGSTFNLPWQVLTLANANSNTTWTNTTLAGLTVVTPTFSSASISGAYTTAAPGVYVVNTGATLGAFGITPGAYSDQGGTFEDSLILYGGFGSASALSFTVPSGSYAQSGGPSAGLWIPT